MRAVPHQPEMYTPPAICIAAENLENAIRQTLIERAASWPSELVAKAGDLLLSAKETSVAVDDWEFMRFAEEAKP